MKKNKNSESEGLLTFGGHLEVLRKMLFRIILVTIVISIVIFFFKEWTFSMLLAPRECDFITYHFIEWLIGLLGGDFKFQPYNVKMISTDLSAQFMTHLSTSLYLGLLVASPYIMFELFRFVLPALYENERKNSVIVAISMYVLFVSGVLLNYYVIFPVSFRFLGTYSVDASIESNITISSYIKTFSTLTLIMGLIFQLPIVSYILAKMDILHADFLAHYRKHAFIVIMMASAIITPPDLFTLCLVTLPMYMLYELCIIIVRKVNKKSVKTKSKESEAYYEYNN